MPTIIITDIGTDPDDILALMVACAVDKFDILAVITTGGDTLNRGRVARRWLNLAGVGQDVSVLPDLLPGSGNTYCCVPKDTPNVEESSLTVGKNGEGIAGEVIVGLAKKFGRDLAIFAIGPLTPLAQACQMEPEIVQQIGVLCIQGQLKTKEDVIEPDFSSFNLREDKTAAEVVFNTMQGTVPFKLLGKHAAYAVPLYKDDIKHIPNFIAEVKTFLLMLMNRNPDLFQKLYPTSQEQIESGSWFEDLDHVCNPYDPLLFLAFAFPDLFEQEHHGHHATVGNDQEHRGVRDNGEVRKKMKNCTEKFFIK